MISSISMIVKISVINVFNLLFNGLGEFGVSGWVMVFGLVFL